MRRLGGCIVLSVLLCAVVSSAAEKDEALDKVRSLGTFIEDDEYQKALNLIDALQSDIYALSVNKERPEIDSTTYINHYFKFRNKLISDNNIGKCFPRDCISKISAVKLI